MNEWLPSVTQGSVEDGNPIIFDSFISGITYNSKSFHERSHVC